MPTYDFRCESCKKSFQVRMKISEYEKARVRCPKCNSEKVIRRITAFNTITSKKS